MTIRFGSLARSIQAGVLAFLLVTAAASAADFTFAVIGDFGGAAAGTQWEKHEREVATLVKSWKPALILTVGDNNYPKGESTTIDRNIGQFYREYIHPYKGSFGEGGAVNRFWPTLGNHDWMTDKAKAYLDYFTLPGNERYYDFAHESVHFFALDSDSNEPDGTKANSTQALWLKKQLADAKERWKIVYFHHSPYSTTRTSDGKSKASTRMRWPFKEWGADAVLAGHSHNYELTVVDGVPYFVNGLGGDGIDGNMSGKNKRVYKGGYGAMRVAVTDPKLTFEFVGVDNNVKDTFELKKAD